MVFNAIGFVRNDAASTGAASGLLVSKKVVLRVPAVAVTMYAPPVTALAVNVGAVATPFESVVSCTLL